MRRIISKKFVWIAHGIFATLSVSSTANAQIHLNGDDISQAAPSTAKSKTPAPQTKPVKKEPHTILDQAIIEEPSPNAPSPSDLEQIRERYSDGKVHVERSVRLDDEGNYVNHGDYRELSPKGDLIASGKFVNGLADGVWFKVCQTNESKMFTYSPFSKFAAPFQSTAEFSNGTLEGVWTIIDKDNRVVSQIELHEGKRHGTSTFYAPNGKILTQAHYEHGVLHGRTLENSIDGKLVRDEQYTNGQRTEVDTQYHPNKAVKSVTHYLSAVQKVNESDNWMTSSMASLAAEGDRVLHGVSKSHYENGQLSSESNYDHGELHGGFTSWHPNGEKAASGRYEHGVQVGPWVWRHPNGMKRAVAEFVNGQVNGKISAWNDQGKAVAHESAKPALKAELISAPQNTSRNSRRK